MQSTVSRDLLQSIPCRPHSLQRHDASYSTMCRSLLLVLRLKREQWSQVVTPLGIAVRFRTINTTAHGWTKASSFLSYSSDQTFTTDLQRSNAKDFLTGPDEREEIKTAMREYLELTLRVPKSLALEISQNSPLFVDEIAENLKAVAKVSSSEFDKNLNIIAVKELLAKSKFKGVQPFLESLGVNPEGVEKVSKYARSGVKGVLVKIDLLKNIGIKPEEIPKVIIANPRFLSNAVGNHQIKVQYLAKLGLSPEQICKLVNSYPNSLSFGLKNGELPLVEFLKKAGVKDIEIGKVLARCPQLLTLNVEKKLQPAIETLASVGITGSYLARVLVTQPSLLRRRLERNIAFCKEFGLDAKPGVIARLLVTCPNFSIDGCKARVSYLICVGLTKEKIVSMINKNPAFMSLNVQTALAPKVDYLVNVMGRSVEELVTSATFLTMSLDHRIKPRHSVLVALKEAGLLSKTYSLNTIISWSEEEFFKKFVENKPKEVKELWLDHSLASDQKVRGNQTGPII